jgi:hypothetical protein
MASTAKEGSQFADALLVAELAGVFLVHETVFERHVGRILFKHALRLCQGVLRAQVAVQPQNQEVFAFPGQVKQGGLTGS